jgi:uncharacterized membrane protein
MGGQGLDGLILVAALGCGLVAGIFFAFSTFVMAALARLPAPHGIAAMQSINVAVINPVFLTAFFGTGAACLALAAASPMRWGSPDSPWLLAGGLLYLVGTLLVTMLCNVPCNNALAAVAPDGPEGAALWKRYVASWTAWNHVRAAAALAAAASFTIALRLPGQTM